MSDELKPCPFCGSTKLKTVVDDGIHFVQCRKCESTGPTGFKRGDEDDADWNTRAQPSDGALTNEGAEPVAYINPAHLETMGKTATGSASCVIFNSSQGGCLKPLYSDPPAPASVVLPERDDLRDVIAAVIGGDAYDCTRVWSAWGVGTMDQDDFVPIVEQDERLYELADALLDRIKELNP